MIHLPIHFGDKLKAKNLEVNFLAVDMPMTYNAILGRPALYKVKAVIPPCLIQLQFEANNRSVGEMHRDQRTAWKCYLVSIQPLVERTKEHRLNGPPQVGKRVRAGLATMVPEALVIHTLTSAEPLRPRPKATGDVEQVPLEEERSECTVQLGRDMTALDRESLLSLIQEYKDVFAFGPEEIPGITPTVMEHQLNVDPHHRSVIQKKRHMGLERETTANAEVQKLLEARFIRECQYLEWISNVVLVKKPNRTWRMCVDFTVLNKACTKDSYPLLKIDKLVDATT